MRKPPQPTSTDRAVAEPPAGFVLVPDALDEDQEASLITRFDGLAFEEVRLRGVVARRKVFHFGTGYVYERRATQPAPPIPGWLEPLRTLAESWTGIRAEAFAELLITRYPPGAGIGWHRDAPVFGPTVVGISLCAPCLMRFRRQVAAGWQRFDAALPRRSGYRLGGAARAAWQHSIPPVRETRYSITLRTLRTEQLIVSDRGLRHGLLVDRFGG